MMLSRPFLHCWPRRNRAGSGLCIIYHTRHRIYEPPPAIVVRREKREDSIFSTVSLPAIAQCQCATAASDAMASVCDPFVVLCLISNILGDQNALFVSPQKRRRCITHITTPSLSHTSAVQLQPAG